MAKLENTFSWSRSRAGTFDECLRKYWLQYYGSWGGWEAGCDPRTRRIYVLKNMRNRWMWAGTLVHEAVQTALERMRDGKDIDEAELTEQTLNRMRREYRMSRDRVYLKQPKTGGLLEHHYAHRHVPDQEWAVVRDHVAACIRGFFASPFPGELWALPREGWLAIEEFRSYPLDGVPVWVIPDLAYMDQTGVLRLIDWKTARAATEPDPLQLRIYALFASERWQVPADRIRATEYHLATAQAFDLATSPDDLEAARAQMHASIAAMRALLLDPAANAAAEEDFARTDDTAKCARCGFLEVCRPDLLQTLTEGGAR
jgi:hypothetical protein